jgi:ferritin-like metal-binding protein YciE
METMINLNDLLKHEIMDLYSAEEQIIEALPGMIDKAKNPELKKALREHLRITEEQKNRLDKIKQSFGEGEGEEGGEKKGFFSRLFGGGGEKCKGMEGLITEGEKIMKADITEEALDAAIIASAQKIEHYEICGYGTARAFARELQLTEVERLLTQTLNEEYTSDDMLTELAVGKLNLKAEQADGVDNKSRSGRSNRLASNNSSNGTSPKGGNNSGRNVSSKKASKSSASKGTKSSGNGISKSGGSSNRNAVKANSSKGSNKSGSFKGNSKNASASKGSNKSGLSKGNNKSGGSSSKGNSKRSPKSSRTVGSKSSSKSSSKGNSPRR